MTCTLQPMDANKCNIIFEVTLLMALYKYAYKKVSKTCNLFFSWDEEGSGCKVLRTIICKCYVKILSEHFVKTFVRTPMATRINAPSYA